jgi:hypothetical protein
MAQPSQPVPAERLPPPGDQVEAPELTFEPPDEPEKSDAEEAAREGDVPEPPD